MGSAAVVIHAGSSSRFSGLSLEEEVESLLFVGDCLLEEPFDMNFTLGVILDGNSRATRRISGVIRQQIKHLLVVDLEIAYRHSELVVVMRANLFEDLVDGSWNDAPVFEIGRGAIHGESLACSSLAIAHDGPVEPVDHRLDDVLGAELEDVLLRRVVHQLVEFELPSLFLIVDETSACLLRDVHCNVLVS